MPVAADQPVAPFRDRTLTWFRLGEALEDSTGMYELDVPEDRSARATQLLIAVSAAAGMLIALAYIVAG